MSVIVLWFNRFQSTHISHYDIFIALQAPETKDVPLAIGAVLPVLLPREGASRTTRVLQDLST